MRKSLLNNVELMVSEIGWALQTSRIGEPGVTLQLQSWNWKEEGFLALSYHDGKRSGIVQDQKGRLSSIRNVSQRVVLG